MKYEDLDTFTKHYIIAALWSSNDESTPQGGDPLDKNYEPKHIAPETLAKIAEDCRKFQEQAADLLTDDNCLLKEYPMLEYAGHDFWLTRNGHGCGYWDGDWEKEAGKKLSELSKKFGEYNLYVGDDGLIHGCCG